MHQKKSAPKLNTENTTIKWNDPAYKVYNFIRGLSPFPTAHTKFDNKNLKIYSAHYVIEGHSYSPGQYASDYKSILKVSVEDGWIILDEIKLEGKRKMNVPDFLNGYSLSHLEIIEL